MIITREINLKVSIGLNSNNNYFFIKQEVTILTKEKKVIDGAILAIGEKYLTIKKNNNIISILYENIEKIEDTGWLAGEDIRNS